MSGVDRQGGEEAPLGLPPPLSSGPNKDLRPSGTKRKERDATYYLMQQQVDGERDRQTEKKREDIYV